MSRLERGLLIGGLIIVGLSGLGYGVHLDEKDPNYNYIKNTSIKGAGSLLFAAGCGLVGRAMYNISDEKDPPKDSPKNPPENPNPPR